MAASELTRRKLRIVARMASPSKSTSRKARPTRCQPKKSHDQRALSPVAARTRSGAPLIHSIRSATPPRPARPRYPSGCKARPRRVRKRRWAGSTRVSSGWRTRAPGWGSSRSSRSPRPRRRPEEPRSVERRRLPGKVEDLHRALFSRRSNQYKPAKHGNRGQPPRCQANQARITPRWRILDAAVGGPLASSRRRSAGPRTTSFPRSGGEAWLRQK